MIHTLHVIIWLSSRQDCEENNKQIGHELGVSYRHILKVLMLFMKHILLWINAHLVWFLSRHWSLILASPKFKFNFKSWSQSRYPKYTCLSPTVVWLWNVLAADPDWEGCGLSGGGSSCLASFLLTLCFLMADALQSSGLLLLPCLLCQRPGPSCWDRTISINYRPEQTLCPLSCFSQGFLSQQREHLKQALVTGDRGWSVKMGAFKVSQRQDEVIIKDPNLMTSFLGKSGEQGAQQKAEGWSCGRGWPPQVLCCCFSELRLVSLRMRRKPSRLWKWQQHKKLKSLENPQAFPQGHKYSKLWLGMAGEWRLFSGLDWLQVVQSASGIQVLWLRPGGLFSM